MTLGSCSGSLARAALFSGCDNAGGKLCPKGLVCATASRALHNYPGTWASPGQIWAVSHKAWGQFGLIALVNLVPHHYRKSEYSQPLDVFE